MVLPQGENSIVSTSACSLALAPAQAEPALQGLGDGDVVLMQGNLSLDTTAFILEASSAASKSDDDLQPRALLAGGREAGGSVQPGHCQ